MALGVGPQWGKVLQEPNIGIDTGGVGRQRAAWMERQGTMNSAQQAALDQLTAALSSERDQKMAALAAADAAAAAAKAHSGGGGGGGSKSGGTGPMTLAPPVAQSPWLDQYLASIPNSAPPTYNGQLMPSTIYGPNNVYAALTKTKPAAYPVTSYPSRAMSQTAPHPLGVGVLPKAPAPPPAPTRYASRLS